MKKLSVLALAALAVGVAVAPADAGKREKRAKVGERVAAVDFAFVPKRAKIKRGQRVVWRNREGIHTVTFRKKRRRAGQRQARRFDETISGDDRVTKRFRKTGRYPYICRFHRAQEMKGVVVVRRG